MPGWSREMRSASCRRRTSVFGLSRAASPIATTWQYKRHGDRVRVRDGSTRLSFFAVRLLISGLERNEAVSSGIRQRWFPFPTIRLIGSTNVVLVTDCLSFALHQSVAQNADLPRERGQKESWFAAGIASFEQVCQQRSQWILLFLLSDMAAVLANPLISRPKRLGL